MKTFDGEAFGKEIVSVVKDYLERDPFALGCPHRALEARMVLLEAQAGTTKSRPVARVAA